MMNTLPQDFLVGAATAAHQVEGNNTSPLNGQELSLSRVSMMRTRLNITVKFLHAAERMG